MAAVHLLWDRKKKGGGGGKFEEMSSVAIFLLALCTRQDKGALLIVFYALFLKRKPNLDFREFFSLFFLLEIERRFIDLQLFLRQIEEDVYTN